MTSRVVVFDLDDTLYPQRSFALSGFRAAALAVASHYSCDSRRLLRALIRAFRRGSRHDAFQQACETEGVSATAIPLMLAAYRAHEPRLALPPSARSVLAACRARGTVAVLTNGDPVIQRNKVRALGVESLVDLVMYAAEHHPAGKPAEEVFRAVERACGVEPTRCLMVGDTFESDIAGALGAGWRAIWKRHHGAAVYANVPDGVVVVTRLAEVPRMAEKILGEEPIGYGHAHRIAGHRSG